MVVSITINTEEERKLYEDYKKLVLREGKSVTQHLKELMGEYLKAHGEGNPSFKLEKWQDDAKFVSLPALASDPAKSPWADYSVEDLNRIVASSNQWIYFADAEAKRRGLYRRQS